MGTRDEETAWTPEAEAEATFLAAYDPRLYDPVAVTVDVVALTIRDAALHVLLVERDAPPFAGTWALPGAFLKPLDGAFPDLAEAAVATLAAETGLSGQNAPALDRLHLEQLATYGAPGRDPRMHVISVAYLAFAPELPDPVAGTGAREARWVPVADLATTGAAAGAPLAFDHARIVRDGLERARAKLEYTPLATAFVHEPFTLSDLRAVYEIVWGEELHAPNFRRKVLSTPGFVEGTGETAEHGAPGGGPRPTLYRAGDCRLLYPPILREATEELLR